MMNQITLKKGLDKDSWQKDDPNREILLYALKQMLLARTIDLKALTLLKQGKSFFHIAGAGHEAIQVAIGITLDKRRDWFFPYYRDLALILSLGVTPLEFFLQFFAKRDDPASGGRQLSSHWGTVFRDKERAKKLNKLFGKNPDDLVRIVSQSSPTGTQFLQAVGAALATKRLGEKRITYVSSGEGTTSQGEFHEAVNWASRDKLGVLFVIQNNRYAISVPVTGQSAGKKSSIAEMVSGYHNLKRIHIDGTDFVESYRASREAADYILSGNGPALIEADCVRLLSHSSSDDQRKYRESFELEEEEENCPIRKLFLSLKEAKLVDDTTFRSIEEEVKKITDDASEKAMTFPEPNEEEALVHVFGGEKELSYLSPGISPSGNSPSKTQNSFSNNGRKKTVMVDALNHALKEELRSNKNIYLFGEDVADRKGGVFSVTKGLSTEFGDDRVFNSPLAEASIIGVANGMALAGLKPVVEIQFGDYIWPAFMQIRNETATMRYRSNNAWTTPIVIRTAVGGHIHGGLYHSQNIEAFFAHIPGLLIAYPSNAADAKGLLKTACRLDDPVLFLEHKGLYRQSYAATDEPSEDYLLPFGKARVVNEGNDITIISYGMSLWDSLWACKRLEEEGYSAEIIDLRTIIPLDEESIYDSVKKTGKAIVIHEDMLTGGFGAEIASRIGETCFEYLDGPVRRVAAKDAHIPYSQKLEETVLPSRDRIYNEIKKLLDY